MFCMNCGKPTEGEQTLCAECAAAKAAPAEESFQLNTPEAAAPKASKKKTGLIVGIVAGIVAIAVILAIVFSQGNLEATFSDPNEYMVSVEEEALTGYAEAITNAYGTFRDSFAATPESNAGTAQMHVLLGNEILTLLEGQLATQGVALEMDWLSDILISLDTVEEDNKVQWDVGIGLGQKKILTLSIYVDVETSTLYAGIPELATTFLAMDITNTTDAMTMQEALEQTQQAMIQMQKSLPEEQELQELIVKYLRLLLAGITDVEKTSTTITVGGLDQKATALTTTISEKQLLTLFKDILEAAKVDEKLIAIVEKLAAQSVGEISEDMSNSIADAFRQGIDEALAEYDAIVAQAEDGNYLELVTYVDNKGEVIGRTLTVHSTDEPTFEVLRHATARKGDNFAFEIVIGSEEQSVTITGAGTEKKDIVTASYDLVVANETLMTLEVIDLNTAKLEEGHFDGTVRLIPSQALMEQITAGTNLPVSMLGAFALELKMNTSNEAIKFELRFLANDNTLFGLTVDSATAGQKTVALPEEIIEVEDQYDLLGWLGEVKFDTLLNNLKEAGIPEELTGLLEMYLG